MPQCMYCDNTLQEGAFFCPKCLKVQLAWNTSGEQTVEVPPPPQSTPNPPPPPPPANRVLPQGSRRCPRCNNIISSVAVACPLCGGRQ
jgi:RNA polymerase subunit RPABC4/transcription elongation factor Spt4